MQVASIISDLTTLRACDQSSALALVSARPTSQSDSTAQPSSDGKEDADLARARKLIELHAQVQAGGVHGGMGGADAGLMAAREGVRRAVEGAGRR